MVGNIVGQKCHYWVLKPYGQTMVPHQLGFGLSFMNQNAQSFVFSAFFLFVYSYLCCFLQLYDTIPINKVGREALFKSNREVLLTLP